MNKRISLDSKPVTDNAEAEKIVLDSVFFDNVDLHEAANKIKALSLDDDFSYVVTPNIDHLSRVFSGNDKVKLKPIYKNAAVSLCDSRIIDKLLRLKGKKVKEVIPGSSLIEYMFNGVFLSTDRILIIGVEEKFIEVLRKLYPSLNILHVNPTMGFINKPDELDGLVKKIEALQANYIVLSVGSPRQEVLAQIIQKKSSAKGVGLCVGASVLFLVNAEKRAPVFIQKLHMEWAYRMCQSPKRLVGRYFKNFLALPTIYKHL